MTITKARIAGLLVGLLGLWGAIPAVAADTVNIETVPVRNGIFMLTGQGGNIGLFIGEDGTFLIDDQFAPLTEKHLAAIRAAGGDTPRFLINTHYHADHTGGNENLGKAGALIFSHDKVRERLTVETVIAAFNMVTPPLPKDALPVVTFSTDLTFHLNGDTLHVFHAPRAHTDGDSVIHFEKANVIHTGDVLFNGFYPFIDVDHGGSLQGMIAAADAVLALTDGNTKLIPGHGPLGDRAQLQAYRDMLATAYARLGNLKAQGLHAAAAVAAQPLADLEPRWGKGLFTGDQWVGLIYGGLD
ncbi:MAG: MBL fold metallo-hydrolase [Deferrisomatales bacterium]|nr:MBL fold metallo-hydrolase [Deferrisomatales bacterium]